jgi:hypothetical protein
MQTFEMNKSPNIGKEDRLAKVIAVIQEIGNNTDN